MEENDNNKYAKKFNWQLFTNLGVSLAAIILSICALCKGSIPGPTGPQGQTGQPGNPGSDGKSAYQIYCESLGEGVTPMTEAEWLASLQGSGTSTNELENFDDYLAKLNETRPFTFDATIDDNNWIYTLENNEDALNVYENIDSGIYSFTNKIEYGPSIKENTGDESTPNFGYIKINSYCSVEVNRVGENDDQYVAVHMENMRFLEETFGQFSMFSGSNFSTDYMTVDDEFEFTKINDVFYFIFKSGSFNWHYIQPISEEVYKCIVGTLLYSIVDLPYYTQENFVPTSENFEMYSNNFIGEFTENTVHAECGRYINDLKINKDGKVVSLDTSFEDYLSTVKISTGLITTEMGECAVSFEQSYNVVYGESEHVYYSELPDFSNCHDEEAVTREDFLLYDWYLYYTDEDCVEVINDLDAHKNIYGSIVYQLRSMIFITYVGQGISY